MEKNTKSHDCNHDEDWKKVFIFMGNKESTNGALKDKDDSLDARLTRIDNKLDRLIFFMLGAMASGIVGLIIAVISLMRTF
jgi:hypothetical protein